MSDVGYAWQKLFEAVGGLASGPETIRELGGTATSLAVLSADDFPPDQRQTFSEFLAAMTARQDKHKGSFMASALAMSNDDASRWASKLFEMFNEVAVQMGQEGRL